MNALAERFRNHTAHVGIIGLGYVGLPLCLTFERAGYAVTGFDIDAEKIEALENGRTYIRHIGEDAVAEARLRGRFRGSRDWARLQEMDAIIVCVPTPLTEMREPDLSYVEATARTIANHLRGDQLIVLESSTYPGTTEEVVLPILEATGMTFRESARAQSVGAEGGTVGAVPARGYLAYSPEREDPGNQRFATASIPKLVGGVDDAAGALAQELYCGAFETVVPVSNARVAEMAKILENTYRCVNIALVNELKQLALRMGVDIWEAIDAAATKPFGFQAFYPGPGLGGHCIPIDPYYLAWKAKQYDFTARFIELAGEINTEMPYKIAEAAVSALNDRGQSMRGARLLILGVAYKKNVDDLRESPALKLIEILRRRGARVEYHDPHCPRIHRGRHFDLEMQSVAFVPANAAEYDAIILTTDHSVFDIGAIARHARLFIDTRNATRKTSASNIIRC